MNPLDDLNQRLTDRLDEYVYNIDNRPDNAWLRFMVRLQARSARPSRVASPSW